MKNLLTGVVLLIVLSALVFYKIHVLKISNKTLIFVNRYLMSRMRLEASENRHEDLAESISQASKPILRQVKAVWRIPIVLINAGTFCVGTQNSDPSISIKV